MSYGYDRTSPYCKTVLLIRTMNHYGQLKVIIALNTKKKHGKIWQKNVNFAFESGGAFREIWVNLAGKRDLALRNLTMDPARYEDAPTEGGRRVLGLFTRGRIAKEHYWVKSSSNSNGWYHLCKCFFGEKGCWIALCYHSPLCRCDCNQHSS